MEHLAIQGVDWLPLGTTGRTGDMSSYSHPLLTHQLLFHGLGVFQENLTMCRSLHRKYVQGQEAENAKVLRQTCMLISPHPRQINLALLSLENLRIGLSF